MPLYNVFKTENIIQLAYQVASGVDSGASILGWNPYPLNTKIKDLGNYCTIASNRLTLLSGTYDFYDTRFRVFCVNGVNFGHQIKVRNITDSSDISGLTLQGAFGGSTGDTFLTISGSFNLIATKTLEIQVYASAQTAYAWGYPASVSGVSETYGMLNLKRTS